MELVSVCLWPPPLQVYLWFTVKVSGLKIPNIPNLIKINNTQVGFDLERVKF